MPSFTLPALAGLLLSCQEMGEDPAKPTGLADAGGDQVSSVGSYALLDPSRSSLPGEQVSLVEWVQDPGNPEEVAFYSGTNLSYIQLIGFQVPGVYKFVLQVTCQSGHSYSDHFLVNVGSRQASVIEDVNLEIRVRCQLLARQGPLTAEMLETLTELSWAGLNLKGQITSLRGLEHCANLQSLTLSDANITDLRPLAALTTLTYLNLYGGSHLVDLSPLSNLVNLQTLNLSCVGNPYIGESQPILDISALSPLTRLRALYLSYTPIVDLSPLSRLVNLEQLDLSGGTTRFRSLAPLQNLRNLTQLRIVERRLNDISALDSLTALDLLEVQVNDLTRLPSFSRMMKLTTLNVNRNKLTSLSGLRNLEKLNGLEAADNMITDISELEFIPNLHFLGLAGNQITDLSPLVNNPHIGQDFSLYLNGNPLSTTSLTVHLPALIQRGVTVYQ